MDALSSRDQASSSPVDTPRAAFLKKLHHRGHKFFDSGEFFLSKQGLRAPDVLPGGAPPEACPVKRTPTVAAPRAYRKLDQRPFAPVDEDGLSRAVFQMQYEDY